MAASNHAESAASIKWRFVRNLVEAVETNQLLLHRKIRWLKVSTTALFATIMLLGLNATVEAIR